MRTLIIAATLAVAGLTGCASMSERDRNIVTGAGVGAAAGAVLSGGSTGATVGGAVVGGVIGSQVGRESDAQKFQRRYDECRRYHARRYCDRHVR